ncbi:hypothetical protein LMH87_006237 [Akanthomyces muscarius]|uniref:DUF2415 domain-containing protein n=1 Tax=Akanthomyces muscarius TaxID=2231603 RepID=A0A9W8QMB8_AKAMU|nr:hypothetical protein LMH87_006237 [Akanthomyces muscarius]KAJ4164568.1 hypothetical protein LMH87_006237 [Akanthomyces muscarius]
MTANHDAVYCHTESIVSSKRRKHYRIPVRSQHWQLRSLISAEKRHLIYFPGGNGSNHVQRLNTSTQECETIKLLTFAPRCLVAENGWLCCGSESGDFVAIRLDEGTDSSNPNTPLNLDPDARLPLNMESREESLLSLITQARRSNKSLIAKSVKLANDRVNCITMWFPGALAPPVVGAYTEPVAILANNDCTVTVISLRDFDQSDKTAPLDIVTYPDFVNRATISPDGRIMVAILDDPYLYVHVRTETSRESGRLPEYTWELRRRLMLKSQKKGDRADSRGSFAACFSNSGSYLAVGTQHGVISIYDGELLLNVDAQPLITTLESSRPRSGPGAIRDMAFCPGPFDILAWTEDRGHIGIADVRANFIVRQIVDINADADFEHVNIFDRNTIDPRLLDGQSSSRRDGGQLARGGLSTTRREGGGRIDTLNQPLTPSETLVLEAIQGDRRRRDRITQRTDGADTAMADSSWSYLASIRPPTTENESSRPRQRSSSATRGSSETLNSYRDQRERERVTDRVRNIRQAAREPSDRLSGRRDQRWIDRLGETVAAMREQRERDGNSHADASYLNVLDILQAQERSTGTPAGTGTSTATGAAAGTATGSGTGSASRPATTAASTLANDPERDDSSLLVPLVNQVVNRWEESAIRGTLVTEHAGLFEVPPSPDNTAGLAWSDDGRTLFVGAQNGIYEFQINAQSRLFFPSMQMR